MSLETLNIKLQIYQSNTKGSPLPKIIILILNAYWTTAED